MIPYGKDNWRRNARHRARHVPRRARLRAVPGRRPRHGIVRRRSPSTSTPRRRRSTATTRSSGWPRSRGATGRSGCGASATAGSPSIQVAKLRPPHLRAIVPDPGDRRSLPDRRPLHRRLPHRQRAQPVRRQPGRDERDAARSRLLGRRLAGRWLARLEATPPWLIAWLRQQHDGPYWRPGIARPGLRRDRGGGPATSAAGWIRTSMPRCGCRRAARPRSARSSATGSTASRRRRRRARTSTSSMSSSASSIAGSRASRTASTRSRPSSGSNATTPSRSRSRTRSPADGGRPAPIRIRPSARASGGSAAARCRWSASSSLTRRPIGDGIDRYRHRPTVGTRAALSWGAGGPPNGLGPRPAPDEAFGPTYTSAPLETAVDDPGRARGRAPPGRLGARRHRGRPADRRRARRDLGPGQRRDPQPDPPPLARTTRSRSIPGRVEEVRLTLRPAGYRFAAGHRIRVSVASSAWPVVWPSPFATEFELHRGPATPSRLSPAGRAAGRWPGRRGRPGLQDDAARPAAGRRRGQRRRCRSGGSPSDVIAGSVTVTIHDGGEDVLDDGRRLYSAETHDADRLRGRSRRGRAWRPMSSIAGTSTSSRPISGHAPARPATRPPST